MMADGFENAVIGVCEDFNNCLRLVYSVSKCIRILEDEGLSEIDAIEHFTYNVSGGYVGPRTPIWSWDNYN